MTDKFAGLTLEELEQFAEELSVRLEAEKIDAGCLPDCHTLSLAARELIDWHRFLAGRLAFCQAQVALLRKNRA